MPLKDWCSTINNGKHGIAGCQLAFSDCGNSHGNHESSAHLSHFMDTLSNFFEALLLPHQSTASYSNQYAPGAIDPFGQWTRHVFVACCWAKGAFWGGVLCHGANQLESMVLHRLSTVRVYSKEKKKSRSASNSWPQQLGSILKFGGSQPLLTILLLPAIVTTGGPHRPRDFKCSSRCSRHRGNRESEWSHLKSFETVFP